MKKVMGTGNIYFQKYNDSVYDKGYFFKTFDDEYVGPYDNLCDVIVQASQNFKLSGSQEVDI